MPHFNVKYQEILFKTKEQCKQAKKEILKLTVLDASTNTLTKKYNMFLYSQKYLGQWRRGLKFLEISCFQNCDEFSEIDLSNKSSTSENIEL